MTGQATILVVDDSSTLLTGVYLLLEEAGYTILTAQDGQKALECLQANQVDLIVSAIAMPRMNGYQLYERVQASPDWVHIPFIFLSSRSLDSDIRYGKSLGVDDYLTKPFKSRDLLAVINGKLARVRQKLKLATHTAQTAASANQLMVGSLQIEFASHRVWCGGEPVELSAREFLVLEHLSRRAEQVVSTQDLVQVTHQLHTDANEAGSLVRPLIRSLRRKLGGDNDEMSCIATVRGVGYRLDRALL